MTGQPYFEAAYFGPDGKGGARACKVTLTPLSVSIDTGEGVVEWPYGQLKLDKAGEEDSHLLVSCPAVPGPVAALTLTDPTFPSILAPRAPATYQDLLSSFGKSHKSHVRRKLRNIVLAAIGTVVLFLGGYWGLNNWIAAWAAKKLPVDMETKWGDMLLGSQMSTRLEITQGPAYDSSQAILRRLLTAVPKDSKYVFRLHVVKDPMVNAFALPGGHILLMTGLMQEAGNAEEVAGVLSHEISHVLKRHVVQRIVQSMGWRVWFTLFFGSGDFGDLAFGLGKLMEISYGRDQETEADREGAKLMAQAGLSVSALGTFFDRLSKKDGSDKIPAFISDHPASKKRSEDMKALAKELRPKNPRPLGIDWQAVRVSLKP